MKHPNASPVTVLIVAIALLVYAAIGSHTSEAFQPPPAFPSGSIVGTSDAQTLTNKSIDCAFNTCSLRVADISTGLGTGVATFLATPSATNLYATGAQPMHWISLADQGFILSAGKSGNFTTGNGFRFHRAVTITGVRWGCNFAGTKNFKLKVFDLTSSSVLSTQTCSSSQGVNTCALSSPQSITDLTHVYVAAVYEMSGSIYCGWSQGAAIWSTGYPLLVGPTVVAVGPYVASGDANPSTVGSDAESVEFTFTIP